MRWLLALASGVCAVTGLTMHEAATAAPVFHFPAPGGYRAVECTHPVGPASPAWPGTVKYVKEERTSYEQNGYLSTVMHTGTGFCTHVDAPKHFFEDGRCIGCLKPDELVAPLVLVDVGATVAENPDYALSVKDLESWEQRNGRIPSGAVVCMRTGWSRRWPNEQQYRNFGDDGKMHFPGFSESAARFLVDQRDIRAIGIDTLSLDPGSDANFGTHRVILGAGKYQIENLKLEDLPENGAYLITLPLRVPGNPEMMARVIALVPVAVPHARSTALSAATH